MLALKRTLLALLFALLLFPVLSRAQSLSYAKPEDVGFPVSGWIGLPARSMPISPRGPFPALRS